jgi:transposase
VASFTSGCSWMCRASATGLRQGELAETTLQRWRRIHALREAGVELLDCSRRPGPAMNTVKRHARAATPERIQRVPEYRAGMVDPYRDHLRARLEQAGLDRAVERWCFRSFWPIAV